MYNNGSRKEKGGWEGGGGELGTGNRIGTFAFKRSNGINAAPGP